MQFAAVTRRCEISLQIDFEFGILGGVLLPRVPQFGADMTDPSNALPISRRAFLRNGTLCLAGTTLLGRAFAEESPDEKPLLRIGLATDMHYADRAPAGSRYYRETLRKFEQAAEQFHREKTDAMIELGDFIDAAESVDEEKGYLRTITKAFKQTPGEHHFVLGNHCVTTLTKAEFLEIVERPKTYYSFDMQGVHFIVLDACFRSDGEPYGRRNFTWTDPNIPAEELEWLRDDLKATDAPTFVFLHQRLDCGAPHAVKNCEEVRRVLETSGNVAAVLQGHSHKNDYRDINGIHYVTLAAMIEGSGEENNAYAVMDIHTDGVAAIRGFVKQTSSELG